MSHPAPPRLRTSDWSAWRDGIARVNRAPTILAGVWTITLLVSLPLQLSLRATIAQHLGDSLAADAAASSINFDWMQEFGDQATGLGTTFTPTIIGFGAIADNLSGFLDNARRPAAIVTAAAVYLLLWTFVSGGIIDRFARDRATGSHGFFSASGGYFFRFLRLSVVMWGAYALLFATLHPYLFDRLGRRLIANATDERVAFSVRLALYAVFGLSLALCNLVFDYTKVRTVVEDRRSVIGAIVASLRFIVRNRAAAVALYALDAALFVATLVLYAIVAPGVGGAGWSVWMALAIGQLYVLARLWVKLVFWASETALFQGRLAHARYAAAPAPVWPDSPVVERM
jgi:hypothetical protein